MRLIKLHGNKFVCVCLRERVTHTLTRHYYIHHKGLQLSKVMWVIGTEVSRGEEGFFFYPQRLVGFILNYISTHPHIDMFTDNTRFGLCTRTKQLSFKQKKDE